MSSSLGDTAARRRRCFTTVGFTKEPCGDLFIAEALLTQCLEGAELIERVECDALDVLGQRIFLGDSAVTYHAWHRRGLGQALLFDQQFQRAEAAAAGRHLEHAGLVAVGIDDHADAKALQERAPGDVFGQLLDRDPGLHAPDVRLAQHQLVEWDIARGS